MPLPDEALRALTTLTQLAEARNKDKSSPWMDGELRGKVDKLIDEAVTSLGPYWGVTIGQLVGQLLQERGRFERGITEG